jgi:hypothetical protein
LNELPDNIVIEAGRVEIKGDGLTIIQSLGLLARALETDCDLFIKACNQTPETDKRLSQYSVICGGALIQTEAPSRHLREQILLLRPTKKESTLRS